jgi:hypothetical protein
MSDTRTLNDELQKLKGQYLSSVEFVADYVQLHFDDFTLTAYTPIDIIKNKEKTSIESAKYKDFLCSLIQMQVKEASFVEDRDMTLTFENNIDLKISVEKDSYRGPEALQLTSKNGPIWVA